MTSDDYPWEPPRAGTEAEQLAGALDRLRTTFRWKADDLDAAGLRTTIGASTLTLAGLLKHLARVEDEIFGPKLSGAAYSEPWANAPWKDDPDWDFTSAANDEPAALYALWGRPKDAVSFLQRALAADKQKVMGWLSTDPMFDALKGDPEFDALF